MLYFSTVLQNFLLYTSKEILLFQSKLPPILLIAPNAQLRVAAHLFANSMCLIEKKKAGSILITLGNTFFKQPAYFPAAFLSLLIFQLFFPVILNRVRCRSVMNYLKGI